MPDIRYNFIPSGHQALERAFEGIEKRATRAAAATRATGQAAQRSAAQGAKAGQRWAQLEQQLARKKRVARERAAAAAKRSADAEVRANERKIAKIERQENRLHAKMTRQRERRVQQEQRAATRVAAARHRQVAGMVAAGAGMGIRAVGAIGAVAAGVGGAAARQSLRLQDLSTRIAVQGRGPGQAAVSPTRLRTGFEAAAEAVPGAKATGVAEAVQAIVTKTGDLKTALAMQGEMATLMVATGAEGQALGKTMGDLMEKFDIKTVSDMRDAMAALVFQGKKGSFELEDAAQNFAKIGAAAERFGGMRGVQGVRVVGGLSQISRRYVGTGEEAATTFENMFRELISKSGMIEKKTGVKVFADKGKTQARDIQDVLVETIAGFKGNKQELQKIFGARGVRGVSGLIETFVSAKDALGPTATEAEKTAAGMAAMREVLRSNIEAGGTWAEVQKDAAIRGQTTSATLTAAWEKVVRAMGSEFTPAIMGALKQFMQLEKETGMLSKGGAALGKVFVALAEAAGIAAEGLEWLGLLKPKDKEEAARREAGQRRAEAQQTIADLDLSKKTTGAMDRIIAQRDKTKGEQVRAAKAAGLDPSKFLAYRGAKRKGEAALFGAIATEDLTAPGPEEARSEFLERYAGARGGVFADPAARRVARELEQDPMAAIGQAERENQLRQLPLIGGLFGGERNEEQVRAMRDYAEQLTLNKTKIKDADPSESLSAMEKAANAAAVALQKIAEGGAPGGGVLVGD